MAVSCPSWLLFPLGDVRSGSPCCKTKVWNSFRVHVVCPCVGFEVLIDVVAHMFDRVVGFFLASCVHNRIVRLGMLRHKVMGISRFADRVCDCGPMGMMRLATLMAGAISGRRTSRWNASTSGLCVEVPAGEKYSLSSW